MPAGGPERVAALAREQSVPADAIALLEQDHREAEAFLAQFEQCEDPAQQEVLARRICLALTIHTVVEEEQFYPAARKALDDAGRDLLDEAEVEHGSAKTMIAEIEAMTPSDRLFSAKVKVLGEYVKHHIQEEETKLFPALRDCALDFYDLGAALAERKLTLLGRLASARRPRRPRTRRSTPQPPKARRSKPRRKKAATSRRRR